MSKTIRIVRTFPSSWYNFIVEGDATGLSETERLVAESALSKAFPDGGDIVAVKRGTKPQAYSTLVCESYSVNGMVEKNKGKTFKVKVEADEVRNPETYKKYVSEGYETLKKRHAAAVDAAKDEYIRRKTGKSNYNSDALVDLGYSAGRKPRKDAPQSEQEYYNLKLSQVAQRRRELGLDVEDLREDLKKAHKEGDTAKEEQIKAEIRRRNDEWKEVKAKAVGKGKAPQKADQRTKELKKEWDELRKSGDVDVIRRQTGENLNAYDVFAKVYDEWKDEFGTELAIGSKAGEKESSGASKAKSPDGTSYVSIGEASRTLSDAIVKAFADDDTEKLASYRKFLPILAYEIVGRNALSFKMMSSTGQKSDFVEGGIGDEAIGREEKHATFQVLSEKLDKIYDVAFGLSRDEETMKELAEIYPKGRGVKSGFHALVADGELPPADDKDARTKYAKDVINKVFLQKGSPLIEYSIKQATNSWLARQMTIVNTFERSRMNRRGLPFIEWFNKHKKEYNFKGNISRGYSNLDSSMFEYARGQFILDSLGSTMEWVIHDVGYLLNGEYPESEQVTIDGLIKTYARMIGDRRDVDMDVDSDSRDLLSSDRLACFRGMLIEYWKRNGLECPTESTSDAAPFDGSFAEFRDDFSITSWDDISVVDEQKAILHNEFEEFSIKWSSEYKSIRDKIHDTGKLDTGKTGQFTKNDFKLADTKTFNKSGEFFKWFRQFVTKQLVDFVYISIDTFRKRQVDNVGELRAERGMTDNQARTMSGGNDDLSAKKDFEQMTTGEDDAPETPNDDILSEYMKNTTGGSGGIDGVDFDKLSEEFIACTDEQVENMAENLNINKDRAKDIHRWWEDEVSHVGGVGDKLNMTIRNDKEVADIREKVKKAITDEEKLRDDAYKAAKDALEDAKQSGDKGEIAEAKKELEEAKKRRKLTAKEKSDIQRRIKHDALGDAEVDVARADSDLNPEMPRNTSGRKSMMSHNAFRAGEDLRRALIRDEIKYAKLEGSDDDTYRGTPDFLVLLMYRYIIDYMESENVSLESAISFVTSKVKEEYSRFVVRELGLHKVASMGTAVTTTGESVDGDKFLSSLEATMDLLDAAELDAQQKLDILEALAESFNMWCEKNGVVPGEINPAEDEDAVANHPEDAE